MHVLVYVCGNVVDKKNAKKMRNILAKNVQKKRVRTKLIWDGVGLNWCSCRLFLFLLFLLFLNRCSAGVVVFRAHVASYFFLRFVVIVVAFLCCCCCWFSPKNVGCCC